MLSPNQAKAVVVCVEQIENDQSMQEEAIVEHEHVATSSNATPIIKGKRTKRQRPQSPISFCLNLNPDEVGDNNTPESEESRSDICINIPDMKKNTNIIRTTMLSDDCHTYEETKEAEEEDEEEEIANCLILLAQGQPRWISNNDDDYYKQPIADQKKFTSKKFMETPYGDKAGYYVYECKTCFKTFPSFQALGGHRASHMKPKKEEERTNNLIIQTNVQSIDSHYNNQPSYNATNNKKQRIHECSTCGAEFLSGQALGGHMRRHRATTINATSRHNHNRNDNNNFPELASSLSFMSSIMTNTDARNIEAKKLFLNLDLNLAAPQEDESCKVHSTEKE